MDWKRSVQAWLLGLALLGAASSKGYAQAVAADQAMVGPVNAILPLAGPAFRKELAAALPLQSDWTIQGWIRSDRRTAEPRTIASLVNKSGEALFDITIAEGEVTAGTHAQNLRATIYGTAGDWLPVTITARGGEIALQVGKGPQQKAGIWLDGIATALLLAPRVSGHSPFGGSVVNFRVSQGSAADLLAETTPPDASLIPFETSSPSWPLQTKQYVGLDSAQDPKTLPQSRSKTEMPLPSARLQLTPSLTPSGAGRWKIGAWRFISEPEARASAAAIATPGFNDSTWLAATVPGTALTTYLDNGAYRDPAYGLNNLLIPEKLGRQDYWYRTEFVLPDGATLTNQALIFEGINYAAEIWVNGQSLGSIKGAFIRGRFALPASVKPNERVAVAVRVSPPPHGGLPHEESLRAGPGQNGGQMAIDGPTFAASEGWDWVPTVRDRATGIWQDVVLEATGAVRLGDPHVQTVLPKPDNSIAELTISVPVVNQTPVAVPVTVTASLGDLTLSQVVQLEPSSAGTAIFAPEQFKQLRIINPELWWPNGYGKPALQQLRLAAQANGVPSDTHEIRFGIREISYELSALDSADELQRVTVLPDRSQGEQLIDVSHPKIRKVNDGWVVSLARNLLGSPALVPAAPSPLTPQLLIKVNGVPIAVRGGNWGMDDWLKRVSRERMEPYFRLHQQANVNTIRNWLGQSTERVFFDLADEYGLLVLNDFWISTQDHNGEPGDSALLLRNADDTIGRFQYHPSIALWIGRNEGVPPPVLNTGLDQLVRERDGTGLYLPNSRTVLMSNSGPWNYQPPEAYFTRLARGFSTEVGTPSFPTLETFKTMMPEADQWPISDSWAYHDWHQGKAGDVAGFMKTLTDRFGAPTDLADFEKKAQLLNYESHRAIFEGMNDGLFERNSGRLLWMTHPAWPSTLWQIYSHNYDTQASYFGFKKGTEPVHVQLNLPGREVAVVNSLTNPIRRARVTLRTYSLEGALLSDRTAALDARGLATTKSGLAIDAALFNRSPVVLASAGAARCKKPTAERKHLLAGTRSGCLSGDAGHEAGDGGHYNAAHGRRARTRNTRDTAQ
ncbi:glycoside hydrolase family 2 [Novosphingobium sp. MW5]|nr:glycoside hydrolase family 2 [Novosphingobium sp. MW5]